ncbi:alanine racemase [Bacillus sp. ISL-75]|uniref:alanine racemase n=1 Tax=Bacillus sp. ISL-75 TaxID=2819137 RepID=UPI001BE95884|nr:alanine racemase [Bacillus sp. ISL-75]MBT2730948.1 alanine racemase [Bacillus sp. ISL-75]
MNQLSYRDTWAEISLDHIKNNYLQFRQFVHPHAKIMAVVKADGYGHGAIEIAKTAIEAGADYLAVALVDEAIKLRLSGITQPILVLGYTPTRSIRAAILENITLTVFDHEVLDEVIVQADSLSKTASIHLKIDTGMSRIGVTSSDDALILAKKAMKAKNVCLEGVFTHFANADSENSELTYAQFNKFQSIVEYLENNCIYIPIKHCCNSAATMKFPEMHLDMVRIGVSLYGLYPDASLKNHSIQLKQAMTLKTKIAAIKKVAALQAISYGWTWKPERVSLIATLPLGYADGLSRLLSNRGKVLIHGKKSAIAGRVCMDQTMIDITDIQNCSVGDVVTIFGESCSSFQSVDEIAHLMGTINYEVVCLIGKRVPRVYDNYNDLFKPAKNVQSNLLF